MQTQIQIIRDGGCSVSYVTAPLRPGEHGTVQALDVAAQIVRLDAPQPDIRKYVLRHIVKGVRGHDQRGEIEACFKFARDGITYRRDPAGIERIADLWSCIYALSPGEPEGDCLIKSTVLATSLATLGFRPFFAVIKQTPRDVRYRHVFVGLNFEGKYLPLDPTPEETPSGTEAPFLLRRFFMIFN